VALSGNDVPPSASSVVRAVNSMVLSPDDAPTAPMLQTSVVVPSPLRVTVVGFGPAPRSSARL